MCRAGGRRCAGSGSHGKATAAARQRKSRANRAYRAALAAGDTTAADAAAHRRDQAAAVLAAYHAAAPPQSDQSTTEDTTLTTPPPPTDDNPAPQGDVTAAPAASSPAPDVPAKPKRMSEKRYRELYDSDPLVVQAPGVRITCAGPISAAVVAATYRDQGMDVHVRPATRDRSTAPDTSPAPDVSETGTTEHHPAPRNPDAAAQRGDVTVDQGSRSSAVTNHVGGQRHNVVRADVVSGVSFGSGGMRVESATNRADPDRADSGGMPDWARDALDRAARTTARAADAARRPGKPYTHGNIQAGRVTGGVFVNGRRVD